MADKMTNVKALAAAIETLATVEGFDAEVIEKLGKIKTSFEKKGSTLRKPTATQIENENIKVDILDAMASGENFTVTDLVEALGNKHSNQKISALMRALIADGQVEKVMDKRKALFHIV